MLADFACHYVIIGHRNGAPITLSRDELVANKFRAARAGLVPILCVWRDLDEREAGVTEEVVARQLTRSSRTVESTSSAKA